jgi:hypothetical protein
LEPSLTWRTDDTQAGTDAAGEKVSNVMGPVWSLDAAVMAERVAAERELEEVGSAMTRVELYRFVWWRMRRVEEESIMVVI